MLEKTYLSLYFKTSRFYIFIFTAMLAAVSTTLSAAPAIFTKNELVIPEGAVISGKSNAYYSDITFAMDEQGNLVITGANKNSLVSVESVEVLIMESFPLQVSLSVSGYLSVPCVKLLSPAVSYAYNQFTVVLAESTLGPAETCIAVTEPFQSSIALDVANLSAGTYTVNVNGIETEFILEMDNSPLN